MYLLAALRVRFSSARFLVVAVLVGLLGAILALPGQADAPPPSWTQACPSASCSTSPSARSGAAMTYDQASGQLVLFGGNSGFGALSDTWVWNGTTWTKVCPSTTCTTSPT